MELSKEGRGHVNATSASHCTRCTRHCRLDLTSPNRLGLMQQMGQCSNIGDGWREFLDLLRAGARSHKRPKESQSCQQHAAADATAQLAALPGRPPLICQNVGDAMPQIEDSLWQPRHAALGVFSAEKMATVLVPLPHGAGGKVDSKAMDSPGDQINAREAAQHVAATTPQKATLLHKPLAGQKSGCGPAQASCCIPVNKTSACPAGMHDGYRGPLEMGSDDRLAQPAVPKGAAPDGMGPPSRVPATSTCPVPKAVPFLAAKRKAPEDPTAGRHIETQWQVRREQPEQQGSAEAHTPDGVAHHSGTAARVAWPTAMLSKGPIQVCGQVNNAPGRNYLVSQPRSWGAPFSSSAWTSKQQDAVPVAAPRLLQW